MTKIIDQKATKKRIKELRIQNGYTQEQLAKMMAGSRSYYNSMETGDRELTDKYLKSLSIIYDIDVEEIVIYEQSEYSKLEEMMNSINSYRPANYYFLRNGNLADDLKDLVKYMDSEKITEYNLLDPILTHLGYEVRLINIKKFNDRWKKDKSTFINTKTKRNAIELSNYFGNHDVAVLIKNQKEKFDKTIISIDTYMNFEKFMCNSALGNLEKMNETFYEIYHNEHNTIEEIFIDTRTQAEIEEDETLIKFDSCLDNVAEFLDSISDSLEKLNNIYNPYFESHFNKKEGEE